MTPYVETNEGPVLTVYENGQDLTITMNRPHRLNALDDELVSALGEALASVPANTRVVILRGAGRSFCSGHDLKAAAAKGASTRESARRSAEDLQRVTRAMRACPAPIVGVIQGHAVGAGAEIGLSCDLIVAAKNAQFLFPEVSIGLVVTNGFTSLLPRSVGAARAKEILLLSQRFTGSQALEWGLVNRAVEEADLERTLGEILDRLHEQAPTGLRIAKRLLDEGLDRDIDLTMCREVEATIEAEMTDDAHEAVLAFAENRKPAFTGH